MLLISDAIPDPHDSRDDTVCYIILCSDNSRYAEFWPNKNELIVYEQNVRRIHEMGYSSSRMLEILIARTDEIVSREEIFAFAWPGRVVGPNSLNQAISMTRELIGDEKARAVIQTVPRRGYKFNSAFLSKTGPVSIEGVQAESCGAYTEPWRRSNLLAYMILPMDRALGSMVVLLFALLLWRVDWMLWIQPDLYKRSEVRGALNILYTGASTDEIDKLQSDTLPLLNRLLALSDRPATVIFNTMHGFLDIVCVEGATAEFISVYKARVGLLTDDQLLSCLR